MELVVQKREKFGKKINQLRKSGFIPAELYGHGVENLHLAVQVKDFAKVFKEAGESSIVDLLIDGEKRPVLVYHTSFDPVTDDVTSVDFYQIKLDEKIKVNVPLSFIGESVAIKEGGVLIKAMHELELETLPLNMPHSIEVDLARISSIGQSIYIKDLSLPDGIKLFVDDNTPVATVVARITKEQEDAMVQESVDVNAVKVESEEKKAEREADKPVETSESGETGATPQK
ncbi:MAG: 50S ribosomal protein L25 [bacterium]|nr:50S ribosomal protein L25 [bacterium]